MRQVGRLQVIFVMVGLAFLLVIGLASLLLPLFGYGETPVDDTSDREEIVEPVDEPLTFSDGADGWKVCERDGVTALRGVDISEHQADVDWTALRKAGAEFVMLRMGYRGYTDGGLFEDAHFRENVEAAHKAGLEVGVYFFSQAITVEEAEEEARFVLEALDGLPITWPVAYDWETVAADARTDGLSGKNMTACALAFCKRIRRAGYTPAIYTNHNQGLLYYGYAERELERIVVWLAEYNDAPTFPNDFQMWQYTDSGTLPGVDTAVDLNLSFVDYGKK